MTLTQGFCSWLFLTGQESVGLPPYIWRCCLSTAIAFRVSFLAQIRASLCMVISGWKCLSLLPKDNRARQEKGRTSPSSRHQHRQRAAPSTSAGSSVPVKAARSRMVRGTLLLLWGSRARAALRWGTSYKFLCALTGGQRCFPASCPHITNVAALSVHHFVIFADVSYISRKGRDWLIGIADRSRLPLESFGLAKEYLID